MAAECGPPCARGRPALARLRGFAARSGGRRFRSAMPDPATSYGGHDTGRARRLCSRAYRSRIPCARAARIALRRASLYRRSDECICKLAHRRTLGPGAL